MARTKEEKEFNIERELIRNLVELQKVHTDLAEKFDKLSREISQLLALFETAARSFAKSTPLGEHEKDRDFLDKIDRLLEQNKVLAKGLTLMEERLRERMYSPQQAGGERTEIGQRMIHKENENESERPLPRF